MYSEFFYWIRSNFIYITLIGIVCYFFLEILSAFVKSRRGKCAINAVLILSFAIYLTGLFYVTLGMREPGADYTYELKLFWSYAAIRNYRDFTMVVEVVANIVCFIPMGIFLYSFGHNHIKWPVRILLIALISAGIELSQLIFKLGLFEFDDIVHNFIGGCIGSLLAAGVRRIRLSIARRHGN